jgi:hypothetical protein
LARNWNDKAKGYEVLKQRMVVAKAAKLGLTAQEAAALVRAYRYR